MEEREIGFSELLDAVADWSGYDVAVKLSRPDATAPMIVVSAKVGEIGMASEEGRDDPLTFVPFDGVEDMGPLFGEPGIYLDRERITESAISGTSMLKIRFDDGLELMMFNAAGPA